MHRSLCSKPEKFNDNKGSNIDTDSYMRAKSVEIDTSFCGLQRASTMDRRHYVVHARAPAIAGVGVSNVRQRGGTCTSYRSILTDWRWSVR